MTNQELLKRLQALETAERDVASSMDMPQELTANWEYAETAALARSAITQQREALERIQQERLTWAMTCACNSCQACDRLDEVIRDARTTVGKLNIFPDPVVFALLVCPSW